MNMKLHGTRMFTRRISIYSKGWTRQSSSSSSEKVKALHTMILTLYTYPNYVALPSAL